MGCTILSLKVNDNLAGNWHVVVYAHRYNRRTSVQRLQSRVIMMKDFAKFNQIWISTLQRHRQTVWILLKLHTESRTTIALNRLKVYQISRYDCDNSQGLVQTCSIHQCLLQQDDAAWVSTENILLKRPVQRMASDTLKPGNVNMTVSVDQSTFHRSPGIVWQSALLPSQKDYLSTYTCTTLFFV